MTVNHLSSDSGSATLSPSTSFISGSSNGRIAHFDCVDTGPSPVPETNSFAFGFKYSRAKDISSSGNHLIF